MEKNIIEAFYKIIEDPRCIKYYEDLIKIYEEKNQKNKAGVYKKLIENIKNDSNLYSDTK